MLKNLFEKQFQLFALGIEQFQIEKFTLLPLKVYENKGKK